MAVVIYMIQKSRPKKNVLISGNAKKGKANRITGKEEQQPIRNQQIEIKKKFVL